MRLNVCLEVRYRLFFAKIIILANDVPDFRINSQLFETAVNGSSFI